MKKNKILIFSFSLFFVFLFTTCRKYPDGGFVNQTRLHLFGGHKIGSSKTWKLKLYEVNGIDSTNLLAGANIIPDFYDQFITFKYDGDKNPRYIAKTSVFNYDGGIDLAYKYITVGTFPSSDTAQCRTLNNTLFCSRNIFMPERRNQAYLWDIRKLTKKEFILTMSQKNSYKIILTQ